MRTAYRHLRRLLTALKRRIEAWYVYRLPHWGTVYPITDERIWNIGTRGLFSIFLETLDFIAAYGDKEITVDLRHTPYTASPDENMWTQYFEPVKNDLRRRYDLSFLPVRTYRYPAIREDARVLDILHQVLVDRVQIRPDLLQKAAAFRQEHLPGTGVIGVHIRGTDHARMYGNPPDVERYFADIDRLLGSGYTCIFLATDDERLYQAFRQRYGDTVVTYATHRAEGDVGLHFKNIAPREVGEEVIVDWILLGGVQYFLHGDSNIPTAVLILQPRLPHKNMAIC